MAGATRKKTSRSQAVEIIRTHIKQLRQELAWFHNTEQRLRDEGLDKYTVRLEETRGQIERALRELDEFLADG